METVLFGVIPVLVFIALAARSALRGRARPRRFSAGVYAPDGDGRGAGEGMIAASTFEDRDNGARDEYAARMREPDPIDPTRGGR
ncbi:hypothetical protein [Tomitella cavernea]|uniref:Uncharacterized protein n=1 Tax=Tomitella cavernea TaxID=1387982 RepID=A0ABP9D0V6_9ACTN|nr:hypothetical protein [Tomitella cavernea]